MLKIQLENNFNSTHSLSESRFWSLIFLVSFKTLQYLHKYDELMDASTVSCILPFGITGKIFQKSPPKTTVFPPNGNSILIGLLNLKMSLMLLYNASKQNLFIIGAPSQIISLHFTINYAREVPYLILHVESLFGFSGIANLK